MYSKWGETINRDHPLHEYPRPQLVRSNYLSLNGMWDYQITPKGSNRSNEWKKICVPFALGSLLSMSSDELKPDEVLHYRLNFDYKISDRRIILNFEAVDQYCKVYINGNYLGEHHGGYSAFSFEITNYIKEKNELILEVEDASDQGIYAYGKQKLDHKTIFYTPTSGIWQSVWIEEVGSSYIKDVKITPMFDENKVYMELEGDFTQAVVTIYKHGIQLVKAIISDKSYVYSFESVHPWTIEDPFLYDVDIETDDDQVKTYFGMRKFSKMKDKKGNYRFALNNVPIFLSGILDQGYISDGMYTYPSDEAIRFDIENMKAMGFNMVRKHAKVDCRRWYYYCDKVGLLVFQDMPNGGEKYSNFLVQVKGTLGFKTKDNDHKKFARTNEDSRNMYYQELHDMIYELYNATSICTWVPFNEGWGQFDAKKVTKYIRKVDDTRLIDHASGWFDQGVGDFDSKHIYFRHYRHKSDTKKRISIISEFGGYNLYIDGHSYSEKAYGYKKFKTNEKLEEAIIDLYKKDILNQIYLGVSGCIYTQLSDVEEECNGLFSFDRKVLKVDPRIILKINNKIKRRVR